jgi:methionyl-tRNA synthetase
MSVDLIVTTALNYANGPLHLGHILEDIQADIWVRAERRMGLTILFISGNDSHGTPIMLHAEKNKQTPEDLITQIRQQHCQDLDDFLIEFDCFHSTHSNENKELTYDIYAKLEEKGLIKKKTIMQAFDEEKQLFLPDRYIKGTCPKCHAKDQYGDNCEVCGTTYKPEELIEPYSILTGKIPTKRESEHYFFTLSAQQKALTSWLKDAPLQSPIRNKLQEWLAEDLRDWDISRDAPYFGFLIPGCKDKYFYVWLDAPIGYLAGLKKLHNNKTYTDNFATMVQQNKMVHFVGKDIIYFHGLFWPAMLLGADYSPPKTIVAHGFLTLNGEKMSKSRGNFLTARDYLDRLDPELLRYYLASKLDGGIEDLDLNWQAFQQKINSDLVGKIVNIASRCSKILATHFELKLCQHTDEPLWKTWQQAQSPIIEHYHQKTFHHALTHILALADQINQYLAQEKPWVLIKEDDSKATNHAHQVCTMGLHGFYLVMALLEPITPKLSLQAFTQLNVTQPATFKEIPDHRPEKSIQPYTPLLNRVQQDELPRQTDS